MLEEILVGNLLHSMVGDGSWVDLVVASALNMAHVSNVEKSDVFKTSHHTRHENVLPQDLRSARHVRSTHKSR